VNERLVRFNEAQEAIGILLIVCTADPKPELWIGNRQDPAPVLGKWLGGFKAFFTKPIADKLRETLSVDSWIDLFVLTFIRWE